MELMDIEKILKQSDFSKSSATHKERLKQELNKLNKKIRPLSESEMFLVKYSLSDENELLAAEYMTPFYLDDENQKIVKPLLKVEPKIYKWKSGRFE